MLSSLKIINNDLTGGGNHHLFFCLKLTDKLFIAHFCQVLNLLANLTKYNNPHFRLFFYFVRNLDRFWFDSFHGFKLIE